MADKPKRPDILDFMKQFADNMNKQSDQTLREKMHQADTLAHLSELTPDDMLKEISEEWDALGMSATQLLVRAVTRPDPNEVAVRALIIAAYRCDAMSKLFNFIRTELDNGGSLFTVSDAHIAQARAAIDELLKRYMKP